MNYETVPRDLKQTLLAKLILLFVSVSSVMENNVLADLGLKNSVWLAVLARFPLISLVSIKPITITTNFKSKQSD